MAYPVVSLAEYGPASAHDVWTRANLDKAVVSRETGTLAKKGLVEIEAVKGSARKRSEIRLSKTGTEFLKRSFSEVLTRHDNLTAGLDPASIETFVRVARHLEDRIPNMSDRRRGRCRSMRRSSASAKTARLKAARAQPENSKPEPANIEARLQAPARCIIWRISSALAAARPL